MLNVLSELLSYPVNMVAEKRTVLVEREVLQTQLEEDEPEVRDLGWDENGPGINEEGLKAGDTLTGVKKTSISCSAAGYRVIGFSGLVSSLCVLYHLLNNILQSVPLGRICLIVFGLLDSHIDC